MYDIYQKIYTQKERKSGFFLFFNRATASISVFCVLDLSNLIEFLKLQQLQRKLHKVPVNLHKVSKLYNSEQILQGKAVFFWKKFTLLIKILHNRWSQQLGLLLCVSRPQPKEPHGTSGCLSYHNSDVDNIDVGNLYT